MRMESVPAMAELPLLLMVGLSVCVCSGRAQTDSTPGPSRPYNVLLKQNMVLLGSILSVLFLAMIVLAVCVYKPIRRR
ncbi:uncharacterized protein C12orf76 homolog [Pyxicephalus adspersus]|uniref:Uncharacterized protein n=1 Tax=Pyxicephalus adspersus TaxID=30357 RepID=A0AAV3ABM4_PYXAD|nr:TPA: hypothetical protein GDO54_013869 [Pyxicephalus adspersus]